MEWELGEIALKLKPEIEQANMAAGGRDQNSTAAKSGLATLPNPISPVDTRKELANVVGLGERAMGKVIQIDEHAPAAVREALDRGKLSISQGYSITRALVRAIGNPMKMTRAATTTGYTVISFIRTSFLRRTGRYTP